MDRDHVLGDRERDARAADLDRVHVAVNPRRGARLVGVGSDLEQPEITAFDALADALDADQAWIRFRPVVDDARDLFVAEVIGAEWAHAKFGVRYVIVVRRQLSLSDARALATVAKIITYPTPNSGLSSERQQADDAERKEGERLAGDEAAADQRGAVHVLRLAAVPPGLGPRHGPLPDRREDAADAVPERGGEFDEAAEARRIGPGQDDRVDDEVGDFRPGAALLPRLIGGTALQRDPDDLDHEADRDAEPHQLERRRFGGGESAQHAGELVGHRALPVAGLHLRMQEGVDLEHRI